MNSDELKEQSQIISQRSDAKNNSAATTDDDLPPLYKWLMLLFALLFALPMLLEFC